MKLAAQYTHLLREEAHRLGFSYVGIAKAEYMDEEARRLEAWLNQHMHGEMGYMANHFDKRVDPTKLVPGAKSVVSLLYNYYTPKQQHDPSAPKISKYAYGKDYHFVIKHKLKSLLQFLQTEIGAVEGRVFVDSAPVLERDWARRSGNGWMGKNTMLIHPKAGSYFFLAELIIDLELAYDQPIKDYCGTCTKCIDACPTEAISPSGYVVDGSKCISYFTIELKSAIPEDMAGQFDNWMFGCDICQEVCPWNRFSKPHEEPDFEPHPDLLAFTSSDWEELTEEVFRDIFRKSAVKRTKYAGLKRNIAFLTSGRDSVSKKKLE
ncbi:MAG: tRNA epoxyqueuosine(34) reductase QueG [Bacteroidota bacterium]